MPFLRPVRARLGATRARVAHAATPAQAWQKLADERYIPASWLGNAGRTFILDTPTRDPALAPTLPHPATIARCATFASDVAGVLAAEAAARSLADALAPWGAPPCTRVTWWSIPRESYGYASTDTRPSVIYALLRAFGELYRATAHSDLPLGFLGEAASWVAPWDTVFPDRANPFRALAQIESAGYASLEYVGHEGTVFLVAPAEDLESDVR